ISLVLPALYPFYLPSVQQLVGEQPAIIGMLLIGAVLLIAGAMLGPRLSPSTVQAPLEEVATISSNTTGAHIPQTIVRSQYCKSLLASAPRTPSPWFATPNHWCIVLPLRCP